MTAIANTIPSRSIEPSRVDVMPLARALALGEMPWERLRAQQPQASAFSSWAWHDAWSTTAPAAEGDDAFVVAQFDDNDMPRVLLPLAVRPIEFRRTTARALTWAIGDYGCPDHLDVLAAPGASLDAVVRTLEDLDWDMIQLDGLTEGAAGVRSLRAALEIRGISTELRAQWPCPVVTLPAVWDEYLATRSPARSDVIRRRERVLGRRGRMSVTFYDSATLDDGWRHLLRLHAERWCGNGVFDARMEALHRRFTRTLARAGRAWISTIDMNDEPISAWYGFTDRDTLHFYQSGRSSDWHKFSVGGVHVGLMMQRAIALGLGRFDFLRGDEPYKDEWTNARRWTYQLVAFRRTARGRMLRLADRMGAVRERLARRGNWRVHAESDA